MLPGPVFNIELTTTARRARYYVIRFVYGICLLFFIVQTADRWELGGPKGLWEGRELSIAAMANLGRTIFITFSTVQGATVLLLTPALVAGVIADERQRKTLAYLMASRLSSAEIILGKLFARLLHMAVFLSIGLPVMSLISLFGGVDPRLVVLLYVATLTTAVFLASLAILISTFARRPREAAAQVYTLGLFWFFGPTLIAWSVPALGGTWLQFYEWIKPLNDPIRWSSPFSLLEPSSWANLAENYAWMVALELGFAAAFVLVAILALRPICRRDGGGALPLARLGWARRLGRIFPRPEVGDDAMLWKERYVSRTRGAARLAIGLVFVLVLAGLGYATFQFAAPAIVETWRHGYGAETLYQERRAFNFFLRVVCTLLYATWCLAIASVASSSVTGEREEDTWTSLTSTPLGGDEIILAKILGAVWGTRGFGALLLLLWLVGLFSGAVHPLGFLAVALDTVPLVGFVAALGVWLSLASKTTARAQAVMMLALLVLNGGYLFCCIPFRPNTMVVALGVTPMIEALSLLSYEDVDWVLRHPQRPSGEAVVTCFLGVVLYAVAALVFTTQAIASFDRQINRPWREGTSPPDTGKEVVYFDDEEP